MGNVYRKMDGSSCDLQQIFSDLTGILRGGKKNWIKLDEHPTRVSVRQLQCATDAFAAEPLVANEDIATLQKLKVLTFHFQISS